MKTIPDYFLKRTKLNKKTGCLIWTGYISPNRGGTGGYGRFRQKNAHRWLYEYLNGPLPKNVFVCHQCDVRTCVSPGHLFAGSHRDNMNDAKEKGRMGAPNPAANGRLGAMKLTGSGDGAFWHKKRNRWISVIRTNGKPIWLGTFKTAKLASAAYKKAAAEFKKDYD